MLGVNVPVPVPVGHHNFGGLRRSKFGDAHMFGPDAARFYTKMKTVSQRWPEPEQSASSSFRSEEHTSELQSLMRISYAVFCLKTKTTTNTNRRTRLLYEQ